MDLSIITVTWNSKHHIDTLIESIHAASQEHGIEHIIVDNASPDNTAAYIQSKHPDIKLIANDTNKGFAAANNQGYEQSSGKYVLFLNPDMVLQPQSLDILLNWFEDKNDIGIASCKLIDEHGNINNDAKPRRFPTIIDQLAILLKLPHIFPGILKKYRYENIDMQKEQIVDSVRGAFFLVRRELIEQVGFAFDPRYFIWFEEVDMCKEAYKHGYKVVYTPIISATDFIGQSFRQRESMWKQKHFTRSMLTYFQKWNPWYQWIWIWLARPIALAMTWLLTRLKKYDGSR